MLNSHFQSVEAFSTTTYNKLTGTLSKVSLLSVYCKSSLSHTLSAVKTSVVPLNCDLIPLWFNTETWAETKSELSTKMLSSPSQHSTTCEYDIYCLKTFLSQWVQRLQFMPSFVWLSRIKLLLCNHRSQRSEYELSDCDSNDWTERAQSVETLREPADEKCADCKKPAQAQVRTTVCGLLSNSVLLCAVEVLRGEGRKIKTRRSLVNAGGDVVTATSRVQFPLWTLMHVALYQNIQQFTF